MAAKKPFLFPFNTTTMRCWIKKVKPLTKIDAETPLSTMVPFARLDPTNVALRGNNQEVPFSLSCFIQFRAT